MGAVTAVLVLLGITAGYALAANSSTCQGYNPQTAGIAGPTSLNGSQADSGTCVTITVSAGSSGTSTNSSGASKGAAPGSAPGTKTPTTPNTKSGNGGNLSSSSGEPGSSNASAAGNAAHGSGGNGSGAGQIQHLTEGELPFTGFNAGPLLVAGLLLLMGGFTIRQVLRRSA